MKSDKFDQKVNENPSKSSKWYNIIINKYLIVSILFVIWMIFFDQNSYFIHRDLNNQIVTLEKDETYFENNLKNESLQLEKLKTDTAEIERIAREQLYMRKPNEDIFILKKDK